MSKRPAVSVDDGSGEEAPSASLPIGGEKPATAARKRPPTKKQKAEEEPEIEEEMNKQLADTFIDEMAVFDDDDDEELVFNAEEDETSSSVQNQALVLAEGAQNESFYQPFNRKVIGMISIVNIVVTAYLTCDKSPPFKVKNLHLFDLVVRGSRIGFQLNTKRFAAAIVSLTNPTCCVLIFKKGKVVCAGCSKLDDAKLAIDYVVGLVSKLHESYKDMHIINLRLHNMVGKTCFPHNIDVKRLHIENQRAVSNPIADGIKMSPPPLQNVGLNRKDERRRSGSTLIYESGYMLIIGAASRHEIRHAYAYVHPIMSKYLDGSATSSFSADKIRRYYTDLRTAYEMSQKSPVSFVVVYSDGTEGTVEDWVRELQIADKLMYYRLLIDNPGRALHNTLQLTASTYEEPRQAIEESKQSKALVTTTGKQNQQAGALINIAARNNDQLALVRASSDATKGTIRRAQAVRKVQDVMSRQHLALRVQTEGAKAVAESQKPKKIQILSMEEAGPLFSGHERHK